MTFGLLLSRLRISQEQVGSLLFTKNVYITGLPFFTLLSTMAVVLNLICGFGMELPTECCRTCSFVSTKYFLTDFSTQKNHLNLDFLRSEEPKYPPPFS